MDMELRPCPFCGGEAGIDRKDLYFEDGGGLASAAFVASCRACGLKTSRLASEYDAAQAWNRRAVSKAVCE